MKILGERGEGRWFRLVCGRPTLALRGGLQLVCGRPALALSSDLVPKTLSCLVCMEDSYLISVLSWKHRNQI